MNKTLSGAALGNVPVAAHAQAMTDGTTFQHAAAEQPHTASIAARIGAFLFGVCLLYTSPSPRDS